MKNPQKTILMGAITLSCFSCDKSKTSRVVTGVTGLSLEVTFKGERYYGLAQVQAIKKGSDSASEFSCVVLMPWNTRPETSVAVKEDISTIKLPSGLFKIVGRRVCTTTADGSSITILPGELSLEAFNNGDTLQNATIQIIKAAEQAGGANWR